MSRLAVVVYHGNTLLGEADVYPQNERFEAMDACKKEIRITRFSPPSERCPPLAVLHTISSCGVCFKMESKSQAQDSPLFCLYNTCLRENKTAIVPLGEEDLHLVAMPARNKLQHSSYFWGFGVSLRLYSACLSMLNLRCLGIVFDLDETLIVANTMRSFEDRIEALQRKISSELDPQRIAGMVAEVKRYQDDKTILKQYVDNDQVIEPGRVAKVQLEIVPPISDNHQSIARPIIRLHERNIILTRINPLIRDTSVLVRLRPAWEDLRSYLTARGRKRFEVYVCTMAERDYALEMWRLLDPESHLINSKELLDRIVCVKAGLKKSLLNVFQDEICHPKMAMVIDDRLKVWDDKDQPRVHVVPAYAPYYAPQAEASNAVPVLCVARNVACNVRGGFFKEFDDGLLQHISGILYEDDFADLPNAPDVSNYLNSEEDSSLSTGNKDLPISEGLVDAEVERRFKDTSMAAPAVSVSTSNLDLRAQSSPLVLAAASNIVPETSSQAFSLGSQYANTSQKPADHVSSESSLQGSPGREEGEVPESELDPDTRRRLLILQHGQDSREHAAPDHPFPLRPSIHVPAPLPQSHGSWAGMEEEMAPRYLSRSQRDYPIEHEAFSAHFHQPLFYHSEENSSSSDKSSYEAQTLLKEAQFGDDRPAQNGSHLNNAPFAEIQQGFGRGTFNSRDIHFEAGRFSSHNPSSPLAALQEIAVKTGEKLDFKPSLNTAVDLRFSFEVWFAGLRIGEGIGRTRREAQLLAAEESLRNLANRYISSISLETGALHGDSNKISHGNENGFVNDTRSSFGYLGSSREDMPIASTSENSNFLDQRPAGSLRSGAVSCLKELCMMEGLHLVFQEQPSLSIDATSGAQVSAQVEVAGRVVGKGIGSSWEEAKQLAAQEAITTLKSSSFTQRSQRRLSSPRSSYSAPVKRMKPEYVRGSSRVSPTSRYSSKNGPPVS
ncbi:RNA polymerase II C-terminal domain phosphatase-like 1 [Nymphaea thermarum]|nr:RNA polymerase II C-terminal domain phosphatase-like 1 [Nymphaea thermarum]